MQKALNFNDVAIVSIKGNNFRIHFWYMSKDDAINIMNAVPLNEKAGVLHFFLCFTIYQMSQTTYYQRNKEVILNRAKNYYRNNREELKAKARDKYRELSEEEKDIKREYGRNRYNNMSKEDKQKVKEYQRNYRWSKKTT